MITITLQGGPLENTELFSAPNLPDQPLLVGIPKEGEQLSEGLVGLMAVKEENPNTALDEARQHMPQGVAIYRIFPSGDGRFVEINEHGSEEEPPDEEALWDYWEGCTDQLMAEAQRLTDNGVPLPVVAAAMGAAASKTVAKLDDTPHRTKLRNYLASHILQEDQIEEDQT
ncbi:hypothetical protein [Thiohalorhabdus sp.]|uniref:hypothetical protein n=1 Tax=Thiohalorhabdus sp. TaxID=3094134 RepID=UPI002FC3C804